MGDGILCKTTVAFTAKGPAGDRIIGSARVRCLDAGHKNALADTGGVNVCTDSHDGSGNVRTLNARKL